MKAFVIYKNGDEFSTSLSNECVESAKKFNINVEKFPGIYDDIDNILKKENLFLYPDSNGRVVKKGVQGCFLSHFMLWKYSVKENIPVLIFEYDALMINPLPNNVLDLFDDHLNLDLTRHTSLKKGMYESSLILTDNVSVSSFPEVEGDKDTFKYLNRNHIKGAFGYIIKPEGAQKLINGVLKDGLLPADIAINRKYINLNYTTPSVARLNPKMLANLAGLSHTKNS